MKRIVFLFLSLLINMRCFSQHLTFNQYELIHNEDMKLVKVEFDKQYTGILGTAFLFDDWKRGRAFIGMKMYNNLIMKFDIYKNKIYISIHDTIFDISTGIKKFDLFANDNDTTVYMTFVNEFDLKGIGKNNFIQLLAAGNLTLVKYYAKEIIEIYESSPYDKEKKFLNKNKYFIITKDKELVEVSINKKNLETVLNTKWKDVSKYAKEKDISFNREEGWAALIDYCNKL